ncbi:MAG TPA: PilZ domain-containing protein [Rhodanobacteraceae bacterium]|nr:PilZ domain-containing protein [Rhodanobacteraceae bacterium]
MSDKRRADRKAVDSIILVTDAITGQPVGRVGNLSGSGLMLIGPKPLAEDALYQFRFQLPNPNAGERRTLEIGMHEQWTEEAAIPGQFWSGLRFIAISEEDTAALGAWLDSD